MLEEDPLAKHILRRRQFARFLVFEKIPDRLKGKEPRPRLQSVAKDDRNSTSIESGDSVRPVCLLDDLGQTRGFRIDFVTSLLLGQLRPCLNVFCGLSDVRFIRSSRVSVWMSSRAYVHRLRRTQRYLPLRPRPTPRVLFVFLSSCPGDRCAILFLQDKHEATTSYSSITSDPYKCRSIRRSAD